MNNFINDKLSVWVVGVLIALLFAVSLHVLNTMIGGLYGYEELIIKVKWAIRNKQIPEFTWQIFFVGGIAVGAFFTSFFCKQFKIQLFPEEDAGRGTSYSLTLSPLCSFAGGLLCMSGLIIIGNTFVGLWIECMLLSTSSSIFLLIMFIEAVLLGTFYSVELKQKSTK